MLGFLSGIWGKIAAVAAIVLALLVLVGKLMAAGRDKERARAATESMRRTTDAHLARIEASKPITPQEEAKDAFNRDR